MTQRSTRERRVLETPLHLLREWKENERVGPLDRRAGATAAVEEAAGSTEAVGGEGAASAEHVVVLAIPASGRKWGAGVYRLTMPGGETMDARIMQVAFVSPREWGDEYEAGIEALEKSR